MYYWLLLILLAILQAMGSTDRKGPSLQARQVPGPQANDDPHGPERLHVGKETSLDSSKVNLPYASTARDAAKAAAARRPQLEHAAIERGQRQAADEKPALDVHKQALRDKYAPAAEAETRRNELASRFLAWTRAKERVRSNALELREQAKRREEFRRALWKGICYASDKPLGQAPLSWREYKRHYMTRRHPDFQEMKRGMIHDIRRARTRWEAGAHALKSQQGP